MEKLPKKFVERVARNLKTYQSITEGQRKRDVSGADTVTVVKDVITQTPPVGQRIDDCSTRSAPAFSGPQGECRANSGTSLE